MHSWPTPQIPELPGRGRPVRVHDSTTGELVVAASGDTATLYACGITPYDATHIGHANTYVAFDLLVRAWRDAGHRVVYTSNVTDVDDPLLERAAATGVDWRALATDQIALFAEDMTALGVVLPDVYDGAVEKIPAVVEAVTELLAAGVAYRVPVEPGAGGTDPGLGDVYADLSADAGFGSVSRFARDVMEHLFAERGGDPDREGKRRLADLCAHYGVAVPGALHTAEVDALATLDVLAALVRRHPGLAAATPQALHDHQVGAHRRWVDELDESRRDRPYVGAGSDGRWPV